MVKGLSTMEEKNVNDKEIVKLFRERNEDAVSEAKKRYEDYCLYIANNVLRDRRDAEECFNDALFAAWNSIPPQNPENLRTYLGKLVRETAVNRYKANNRQKRIKSDICQSLDEIAEIVSGGDVEEVIEGKELSAAISRFLYSADETKRNVFIRRYWFYDPIDSICKRYGFGKSKVLMMLKRTRDDLAEYLKKEGFII
ncbi:MAG: sigma-70 family RNA polymerase sigma factor [Clostridia bacterium]|nr:sigma-70 family RNA polymerase sigma factor [Clostridia bacterium]